MRVSHLCAFVIAFALVAPAPACAKKESPEYAARSFLEAVNEQDCGKAWLLFSSDTQKMINEQAARLKQEGYGRVNGRMYTDAFEPQNLYCKSNVVNRYLAYVSNSVKLVKAEGERAIVSVQEAEAGGFLLPGFFPTKTTYHTREMKLVKEGAAWKIDHTP